MIHIGVLIIIITPAAPDKEEPIRVVPVAQAVQEAIKTPEPPALSRRVVRSSSGAKNVTGGRSARTRAQPGAHSLVIEIGAIGFELIASIALIEHQARCSITQLAN